MSRFITAMYKSLICLIALSLAACSGPPEDFSIIVLPDTQFYSSSMRGGSPDIFREQVAWIVRTRDSLNTVFVTHLGDFVQHGDSLESEWDAAEAAMALLEDPETTGLEEGIPYGIAVGNHDQWPIADADGTTNEYNRRFGADRFAGRSYYGGHFGENNDNHYELVSASGLDFIIVHLEYDQTPDPAVLDWAGEVLDEHSDHHAIVVTHHLIGAGNPADFGPLGQATYDALKEHPNLFLMLGGHVYGEGMRTDVYNGRTVVSLLADYQNRENGGDGWLRILRFSPANDEITVETYSPRLNEGMGAWEEDADSRFVLSFEM